MKAKRVALVLAVAILALLLVAPSAMAGKTKRDKSGNPKAKQGRAQTMLVLQAGDHATLPGALAAKQRGGKSVAKGRGAVAGSRLQAAGLADQTTLGAKPPKPSSKKVRGRGR